MSETSPNPQLRGDVHGVQRRRASDSAAAPGGQSAPTIRCDDMLDLAPAFALGALEPEEHLAVARHRLACPLCARLVEDAERTAAVLAHLVRPVAPAPDIKTALFARIAQAQEVAQATSARSAAVADPSLTLPASRPLPNGERVARPARRLRLPSLRGLAGVARASVARPAAGEPAPAGGNGWASWPGPALPITTTTVPLMLILVVVGGWAMTLYNRANEAATYQDLWGEMGSFLSSTNGTVYELQATDGESSPITGQVVAEPDAEEAMVIVWGLDRSRPDVTYQVWIERDGQLVPVGDLELDDRGNARKLIQLDTRVKDCRRIHVMAQPAGGEGQPVEILATTISPDGPAAGGDGTEGDQSVGTILVASKK